MVCLQTVLATKEVILSTGAIDSPQILMLSGIGPKEHLTAKGIPTIMNLEVGEHLQDHVSMKLTITTNGLGTEKPILGINPFAVPSIVTGFLSGLPKVISNVGGTTVAPQFNLGLPFKTFVNDFGLKKSEVGSPKVMAQYAFSNTGPLTVPGSVEGVAFLSSKEDSDQGWPDIEILQSLIGTLDFDDSIVKAENMKPEVVKALY